MEEFKDLTIHDSSSSGDSSDESTSSDSSVSTGGIRSLKIADFQISQLIQPERCLKIQTEYVMLIPARVKDVVYCKGHDFFTSHMDLLAVDVQYMEKGSRKLELRRTADLVVHASDKIIKFHQSATAVICRPDVECYSHFIPFTHTAGNARLSAQEAFAEWGDAMRGQTAIILDGKTVLTIDDQTLFKMIIL